MEDNYLKKQGYDPITGKDRIGQEIEERKNGKLNPETTTKVEGHVSKDSPNFNRATIPVPSAELVDNDDFFDGDKFSEEEKGDSDHDKRNLPDFKEGKETLKAKKKPNEVKHNRRI